MQINPIIYASKNFNIEFSVKMINKVPIKFLNFFFFFSFSIVFCKFQTYP